MDMKDIEAIAAIAANKTAQEVTSDLLNAGAEAVKTANVGKKWYESKTVWVNLVMALGVLVQHKYGFVMSPDMQAMVITGVNLVLRKITKDPIAW